MEFWAGYIENQIVEVTICFNCKFHPVNGSVVCPNNNTPINLYIIKKIT